jgi:hypothetical protein
MVFSSTNLLRRENKMAVVKDINTQREEELDNKIDDKN